MAYNKNSKYLRPSKKSQDDEKPKESESKKKTYRDSVMTPKRARELAEAEAVAAAEDAAEAESLTEHAKNAEEKSGEAKTTHKKEYRSSVVTPKRARELAEAEAQNNTEATDEERLPEHKGNVAELFTEEGRSKAEKRAYDRVSAKETNKVAIRSAKLRMVLAVAAFSLVAIVLLLFGKIRLPFISSLYIEFSALPELIITIAYGPLYGVAISLVKNLLSILIAPTSWITSMNNLILECIYLFVTSVLYRRMLKAKNKRLKEQRQHRRRYDAGRLLISSLGGTLISLVPQFFITRFIAYPLMEHFYKGRFSVETLLTQYGEGVTAFKNHMPAGIAAHIPDITGIGSGVLIVNLPVTFIKLMLVTLAAMLIMSFMLPFLQYRDKKAKQNITRTG